MKHLIFIALICNLTAFAQTKDLEKQYQEQLDQEVTKNKKTSLGSRGLNRLFIDGVIGAGLLRAHHGKNVLIQEFGITSDFRIGNNFYLGKGNNPMMIRVTYFRVGIIGGEGGIFPYFVPPQPGLSKHFRITEKISIEPGIHVGYIFFSGDPYDGDIDPFGVFVMPEIKFNFNRFSLGFEYSTRKFLHDGKPSAYWYDRYNYVGISLGRRIGRGLR